MGLNTDNNELIEELQSLKESLNIYSGLGVSDISKKYKRREPALVSRAPQEIELTWNGERVQIKMHSC